MALRQAEDLIEQRFPSQRERNLASAGWKRKPASEKQLRMVEGLLAEQDAGTLQLPAGKGVTSGGASALIDVLKLLRAHTAGHLTFPRFFV